ncbi:hypothetical protein BK140_01510 [Paenibacillus macerans]|nr:hypothetical protein BK140_01510 [Paenibacillus macerans]
MTIGPKGPRRAGCRRRSTKEFADTSDELFCFAWRKPCQKILLPEKLLEKLRAKKAVIPAIFVNLREIEAMYVPIFSNHKEMIPF